MSDLKGRAAVVTGASRGIGRAIAEALAREGCDVGIGYRAREDEARTVVEAIESLGRKAVALRADVSSAEDVERLAREAASALGPIEVLVNNAGVAHPIAIDALTIEDFDAEVAANLRSAFLVTQEFLPAMREARFGRLLFVSSVAAQVGGVVGPHYAASKAGLHGLAHAYAAILAKDGITANVLAPALIDTEMVRNNPRARPDLIPVGRFGAVEEAAELAVAILRNAYMTGQTVNINGGWYMS